MHSRVNGNPFPEKWTLVCTHTKGKDLVEPRGSEQDARNAYDSHRGRLAAGRAIVSAYIIPPDGDGAIIALTGRVPASV